MKPIIIESPFASHIQAQEVEYRDYALKALRHSLYNDEAPFASHLLYTQVLNDATPIERKLGIAQGFAWKHCRSGSSLVLTAFYIDYGVSPGMRIALAYCKEQDLPFIFRSIGKMSEADTPDA